MSLTCRAKCNPITLVFCILNRFVVFNNITAVFKYCAAFITFISSDSEVRELVCHVGDCDTGVDVKFSTGGLFKTENLTPEMRGALLLNFHP